MRRGWDRFRTKQEAKDVLRDMVENDIIDNELLHKLIQMHQDYERKMSNFKKFTTSYHDYYKSKSFAIQSFDDSVEQFSYAECLSPSTEHVKTVKKFRLAIQPQIETFRANNMSICSKCNQETKCDVDHEPSFKSLYENYNNGLDGWPEYHQHHARLQFLCIPCHKRKGLIV